MIDGMSIEDGWHMMLKTIIKRGKMHKKDDASILEFLDGFRLFLSPVDSYTRFCGCETTQNFLKLVDLGVFDIEGYPMKGPALGKYVKSLTDGDLINLDGPNDFVYTYPERLYAIWMVNDDGDKGFFDQVDVMCSRLEENIGSNRAVATLYQVALDKDQEHIPCLNWLQATVRDDSLILHVMFRSNDIFMAWPSNMLFLTHLGLRMQDRLRKKYPQLTFDGIDYSVTSAHIYETDLEMAKEVIK